MKRPYFTIVCMLLLFSCTKDRAKDHVVNYLSILIDGTRQTADRVTANVVASGTDSMVIIKGNFSVGRTVTLNLEQYPLREGPYYINGDTPSASGNYYESSTGSLSFTEGQIIVQYMQTPDTINGTVNVKTADGRMMDKGNFTVILEH